ncbi:hypothetical protein HERIO_144 [Hepatospora eriocheir]|uniref:Uncharacterized protein n=1 Tax=Hepatospora eriocheir TaxID=1081669 RepID=A0A1X0QE70_9MICR|nr:hypothetical protein HERIO_144 [Hepatospora eriocheir]
MTEKKQKLIDQSPFDKEISEFFKNNPSRELSYNELQDNKKMLIINGVLTREINSESFIKNLYKTFIEYKKSPLEPLKFDNKNPTHLYYQISKLFKYLDMLLTSSVITKCEEDIVGRISSIIREYYVEMHQQFIESKNPTILKQIYFPDSKSLSFHFIFNQNLNDEFSKLYAKFKQV